MSTRKLAPCALACIASLNKTPASSLISDEISLQLILPRGQLVTPS
jgi:hypothetical protein